MQYQLQGEGPCIVLLHGLFGDLDNLSACANALRQAGYQTLRVSLPGHGDSPLLGLFDFELVAEQLDTIRTTLELPSWSLLGHSLGGKVAMTYAQRFPANVDALLVADIAPVAYQSRHDTILAALPRIELANINKRSQVQAQLQHDGIDVATAAFLTKNLHRLADGGYRWRINLQALTDSYPNIIGALPQLPPYSGPVMMVKGERSDYILPEHRNEIVKRFPNARAHVITGTGHWLHAEKAEQFQRVAIRFFRSTANA
ncbi:alpha/beta fold hydrolase [Ferrimonas lipolytica]|uniref:Alpha/beta fold hydrolase n=1 Tax=Ferrimonas lipolytica TaxID=2724191 RepID=A0A6H1UAR0_9GAMM|nr:alpha/beta fold hydrolase [Ferrimonas lipolytica]QIZ76157.1 alpha/beta fold hydrolase [Ferrimonas lipolytica]